MPFLRGRSAEYLLIGLFGVYALVAFLLPPSHGVAVFGNLAQGIYQAIAVLVLLLNLRGARRHQRVFWNCLAAGGTLWLAGQGLWIYYEVIQREQIPNPFFGDILFFLHIVPILFATSLQPHAEFAEGDHRLRVGLYDFAMLLGWWVFLYLYVVGPWQYVTPNQREFGSRYNFLFLVENLLVIAAFGVMWLRTRNNWRAIYRWLFIASAMYAAASYVINVAIDNGFYYTGGKQDLPLVASILLHAYAGLLAYRTPLQTEPAFLPLETQSGWHARLAMLAVISMPLFGFWILASAAESQEIQQFRIVLTLGCMLILMFLLFRKQMLLDRKLRTLLSESREAFDNLQRLQGQLVQTEKLASIGRLVAGAAHEINNPLTAIMGYSDLLAEDRKLQGEQLEMAQKIRQQARRIKQLVQNFLTFAKQSPSGSTRAAVDLNAVVLNALQLYDLDQQVRSIERAESLPDGPVIVEGDENHLLQMCLHIFNNAAEAMNDAHGKGTLKVSLETTADFAVLKIRDSGPGIAEPARIFDPFYTTKALGKGTGLGLSACYGIVRDHGGLISCQNLPEGGALFEVSLPLARSAMPASAPAR